MAVLANDSDLDGTLNPASVTVTSGPTNGSITIDTVTGQITYTPDPISPMVDTFTYTVTDNDGLVSNPAIVTINVTVCSAPNLPANGLPDGFIQSITPGDGTVGVPTTSTSIVVQFNQGMGNAIAPGQYQLYWTGSPSQIVQPLSVSYDPVTFTATITWSNPPAFNWVGGTQYTFETRGSLQNGCGTAQGTTISISFQTAP
jgi:hypothetical protein